MTGATQPEAVFHMRELKPVDLLGAATALARVHASFSLIMDRAEKEILIPDSIANISLSVVAFKNAAESVGATLAVKAANRLLASMQELPCKMTVGQAVAALNDVESRFADHIADVKMFSLAAGEEMLMQ